MSGVCLDALNPTGCPDPGTLSAAGADGGRLVALDDGAFFHYANRLLGAGLLVYVVLARESCADDDFGGWAAFYAELVHPTAWVLGNEMDAYLLDAESPSSWKMTPAEYADFWYWAARAIRERQPDAKLVIGGLVSGQPSYLDEVLPLLDPAPWGVDIHPYGRDAAGADELFDLYRSLVLPAAQARFAAYREVLAARGAEARILCLEWNRPDHEIAEYEAMLRAEAGDACWFCWSDGMVDPYGLVTANGAPKAEYHAFKEAANMPEPNDAIQKTMREFETAGGVVGTIYTVDDTPIAQVVNTDAGLFVSRVGVPGAQILLDARAKNPFR